MTAQETKHNVIKVGPRLIEKIQNICERHIYTTDSELYYEGQTPIVSYLLLSGEAILFKKRRKAIRLKAGSLFGLKELALHQTSIYGAKIKAGSEVCSLDLSTVKEITDLQADRDLKKIFKKLLFK